MENEITQAELKDRFNYRNGHLYNRSNLTANARKGDQAGGLNSRGYRRIKINGKYYYEHRLIFFLHHGYFPKEIDHINRNESDNRIENLREATNTQNQGNAKVREGVSKFKGVIANASKNNPWKSTIKINGHKKHLGSFHTEIEAAIAYDAAAIEAFGEFAYTNKDAELL